MEKKKTLEQLEARVRELLQDSDDSEEGALTSPETTRQREIRPPATLPATLPAEVEMYRSPVANGVTARNVILSRSAEGGGITHTLEELKRTTEISALREQLCRKELELGRYKQKIEESESTISRLQKECKKWRRQVREEEAQWAEELD